MSVSHLAADDRRQRAEGFRTARGAAQSSAVGRRRPRCDRRPAGACRGERSRGAARSRATAAAPAAARGVLAQSAAGLGIRGNRGGTRDDAWSRARALPSCGSETEGDCEAMNDEKLENLAKRLGTEAAARLDVAATARKVVERLREQPVRRIAWVQQAWLRIAA